MSNADDHRSRRRILFWGILVFVILLVVCIWFHGKQIPDDIASRAGNAMTAAGFDSRYLQTVDGRVVILSGEIDATANRERLVQTVRAVRGVRRVIDKLTVIKLDPARLSLEFSGDGAILGGVMPHQNAVDKVLASIAGIYEKNNVTNQILIQKQVREPVWLNDVLAMLPELKQTYSIRIEASDEGITLTGAVTSRDTRTAIETRAKALLGNLRLNNQIIVKPLSEAKPRPPTVVKLPTLRFKHASTELTEESKPLLDEIVSTMQGQPDVRIEVAAHTDSSGEELLNVDLSERRAQAIVQYFVSRGINPNRLVQRTYGESLPVAENTTKAGRALNRRIEFKVIE